MKENFKRFVLAYSSLILKHSALQKIGSKGEKRESQELTHSGVKIPVNFQEAASFLSLLFQPNRERTHMYISLQKWNQHWAACRKRTTSSKSRLY